MNHIRKIIRSILSEQNVPVIKRQGIDFSNSGDHLVLPYSSVVDPDAYPDFPYYKVGTEPIQFDPTSHKSTRVFSRTHPDGWTISARVTDWEDYFQGVEDFTALHPKFGSVSGNFDTEVKADSEEGYSDFYSKHMPEHWDPGEI